VGSPRTTRRYGVSVTGTIMPTKGTPAPGVPS
jgi:hypothetical protein